jgi:hypothetical protein
MVKSRNSTSFNSDLIDFVEPYPIFSVPKVDAQTEKPVLCITNDTSNINVLNPYETSVYTWSTPDGSIIGGTDPTSIHVNKPGMYIVTQQLMDGCGTYAKDTVTITQDTSCLVLDVKQIQLEVRLKEGIPLLQWTSAINDKTKYYEVQRSINGKAYQTIYVMKNGDPGVAQLSYFYWDKKLPQEALEVSYRIKAIMYNGEFTSLSVSLPLFQLMKLSIYPNPVYNNIHVSVLSGKEQKVEISIVNTSGYIVYQQSHLVKQGVNVFTLDRNSAWTPGLYILRITSADATLWQKIVFRNNKP